jgi:dipeptidyl aminopeptidase/acylaminoacyl peptidase
MHPMSLRLLQAFIAVLMAATAGSLRAAPAVQSFFDEPAFAGASLSPSGRHVAFKVSDKGQRTRLAILDLQTMKPTVVAAFDDADVDDYEWVNDNRLVFDTRVELTGPGLTDAAAGLYAVNVDGGAFRQLVESQPTFFKNSTDRTLLPWRTFLLRGTQARQGDDVLVIYPEEFNSKRVGYIQLQRLNTVTGRLQQIDAPLHSTRWLLDARGQLRVVETYRDNKMALQVRQEGDAWKVIAEGDGISGAGASPRWISPDGTLYAVARSPTRDTLAVHTMDPATGDLGPALLAVQGFDVEPTFVSDSEKLLGIRFQADAEVTHWLDPRMKALQAAIDAKLPNTANRLGTPLRKGSPHVLVEAFADVQPTITYLYDTESKKLTRLGVTHPGIDAKQMGQTDFMRIKARDGLNIPAYLTLPRGTDAKAAKKNLPMVVLVHGGPWLRGMSWRWDAEVQFLASRGYAVLQPEFRGSSGFGWRHFESGFKQWGGAMQTDVADATRWAVAQGIADPKRICIMGASYGGYATLMGLAQEPGLFRCGVNWLGVTDIGLMFSASWSDISDDAKRYGMPRMVGDPVIDKALLDAASPIRHAAHIKQPLLMAYGAWDVRVPIEHGERFRNAVKPHNPNLEWVVYDNEGHGWRRFDTRVDFWTRVEAFLGKHLGAP